MSDPGIQPREGMTGGGEGLEQMVRKGAGVGVGAQLSAEYRRPEASVGHGG